MNNYGLNSSSNDRLYHYGIKGQKWGVRRFQNEDGTLTSAGSKRERAGLEGTPTPPAKAVKSTKTSNSKPAVENTTSNESGPTNLSNVQVNKLPKKAIFNGTQFAKDLTSNMRLGTQTMSTVSMMTGNPALGTTIGTAAVGASLVLLGATTVASMVKNVAYNIKADKINKQIDRASKGE